MSLDIETDCVPHADFKFIPRYKSFISCKERLKTFKEWPEQIRQKPHQLCRNGFFYDHFGDRVTCFACGVTLKNWCVHDDVEIEHKRWSPNCQYIKMVSV